MAEQLIRHCDDSSNSGIRNFSKIKPSRFQKFLRNFKVMESGCWEWVKSKSPGGYGSFSVFRRQVSASRASWIINNGEIGPGLCICHKCDNPPCVNPNHLFVGTVIDNVNDRHFKKRDAKQCGESHPGVKLKSKEVFEIRMKFKTGRFTKTDLGKEFGVHRAMIRRIVTGIGWKSLR